MSGYNETTLLEDNYIDGVIALKQTLLNFKYLRFIHNRDSNFTLVTDFIMSVDLFKKIKIVNIDYEGGGAIIKFISDNSLDVNGGAKGFVSHIYGIK